MTQPEILYEDAQLIVCYKPAGIATQTKKLGQKDMVSILLNHIAQEGTGQPFIGVVHRLDQPVEGVMVFAKTKQAAAKLSAQMKDHSFGKKYYARVQLTEGKTFAEATGHATEGTLRDWMLFDRKENKSCVVEQPWKEQKNVNSKNGVQSLRRLPEQRKPAWITVFRKKSKTNAPQQEKESLLRSSWIQDDIIRSVCSWHISERPSAGIISMGMLQAVCRNCAVIISILYIRSAEKR